MTLITRSWLDRWTLRARMSTMRIRLGRGRILRWKGGAGCRAGVTLDEDEDEDDDDDDDDDEDEDEAPVTHYAGFRSRLLANVVDLIVFAPLIAVNFWALSSSRATSLALLIPLSAINPIYNVFMHARWGQTLGKMVARIRVVTLSERPISWREALLRDSVGIAFGVISSTSTMLAMAHLPESDWSKGWREITILIRGAEPTWGRWAGALMTAWFWGELLVLLFNRKKRALHDFIAGTVVTRVAD